MKTVKVSKILRILKKDGWVKDRQKGSHRQFVHPTKRGRSPSTVEITMTFGDFCLKASKSSQGLCSKHSPLFGADAVSHSVFVVSALSELGKSLGRSFSEIY